MEGCQPSNNNAFVLGSSCQGRMRRIGFETFRGIARVYRHVTYRIPAALMCQFRVTRD